MRVAERQRGSDPWRRLCLSRDARRTLCRGVCGSIERPGRRWDRLSRFDQPAPVLGGDRTSGSATESRVGQGRPVGSPPPGPGPCLQPRLRLASRVPNHRAPGLVLGVLQPGPWWRGSPSPGPRRDLVRGQGGSPGPRNPGFSCSAPPTPMPPTTVGAGPRSTAAPTDPPTGSPSSGPMPGSPRMASTCSPSKASLRRTWISGAFPTLCRRPSGGAESSCPPIPSFR